MIVPMKKVLLLALKSDQDSTLQELRELGVVEVVSEVLNDSVDRTQAMAHLGQLDRLTGSLSSRKSSGNETAVDLPENDDDLVNTALQTVTQLDEIGRDMEALNKEYSRLKPWGEYDPQLIESLAQKGVKVYLCESSLEQYKLLLLLGQL